MKSMQLKEDEFWCDEYGIPMGRKDCLECKARKRCDFKDKVKG